MDCFLPAHQVCHHRNLVIIFIEPIIIILLCYFAIRAILKGTDLIFDSNSMDAIHLYFPKREDGLSSPIDITLTQGSSSDKSIIASFLFSCIERIQMLGSNWATFVCCFASFYFYFFKKKTISSPTNPIITEVKVHSAETAAASSYSKLLEATSPKKVR
jgi:hypothetical protein